MQDKVSKRLNGLKNVPKVYSQIYKQGVFIFILSLFLLPAVVLVALIFGRSPQQEISQDSSP
jgi:hypothetical protein